MITWRKAVPPGETDRLILARRLREAIERAASEDRSIRNNGDFADRARVSKSVLSSAASGDKMPSESAVKSILTAAGVNGTEQRRILGLRTRPEEEAIYTAWLTNRFATWESSPPGAPDYHDWRNLLNERLLNEAAGLNEKRRLDELPGEIWAFLVCSAVQLGSAYRAWFDDANRQGHQIPVIEVLVEKLVWPERPPSWRAAWLLQFVPANLRLASVRLARDLVGIQADDAEAAYFEGVSEAIASTKVETYLAQLAPELVSLDIRQALLAEFRQQRVPRPAAKNRLLSYLSDHDRLADEAMSGVPAAAEG